MNGEPVRPYRGPWQTIFVAWAANFALLFILAWIWGAYRACTGPGSSLLPAAVQEDRLT